MKKGLLISILIIFPFIMSIHPGVANSETFVTGGGIITEGHGKDANRIIFAVNIFTDEAGTPSSGTLQIYFVNTSYDFIGPDNFDKNKFKATEITGGLIETHLLGDDPNRPFTYVYISANGQLNGEEGWSIMVRFSDDAIGEDGAMLPDAVRISIYDPSGVRVYDTAVGPDGPTGTDHDYTRDHAWRTYLDGGNITVFFEE